MDDKALLTALILNNPKLSTKKVIQIYGLSKALEIMNTRELKTIFSTRSWQRIITETQVEILEIESPLYKSLSENSNKSKIVNRRGKLA